MYRYSYNPKRNQKQQPIISFRTKLLAVVLLLIFGGLFYFFLLSSIFQINEIEIVGNKKISRADIKMSVDDYIDRHFLLFWRSGNIFLANSNTISQKILEEQLLADEVLVKKEYFNTIKITVKERRIFAIWCSVEITNNKLQITDKLPASLSLQRGEQITNDDETIATDETSNDLTEISDVEMIVGECFYIDRNGIAFSEAPESSGSLILVIKEVGIDDIILGDRVLGDNVAGSIQEIKSLIEDKDLRAIEFLITNKLSKDIEVVMSEGWKAYLNMDQDLTFQVEILDKALREKISVEDRKNLEYIDLRIPNRVYYKGRISESKTQKF